MKKQKKSHAEIQKVIFSRFSLFFFFVLLSTQVRAADTGFDTGDTGYDEEFPTEEEVLYLIDEGRVDELTAEVIAEYIDLIPDISKLDQTELNVYIQATYGSTVFTESAPAGAQITSNGYLTNGEGGSRIGLNDLPKNAQLSLEKDGSITIYVAKNSKEEIDLDLLVQDNDQEDGATREPIHIVAAHGPIVLSDGSLIKEDTTLTVLDYGVYIVDGTVDYQNVEVTSKQGPVLLIDATVEKKDFTALATLYQAESTGVVGLGSTDILVQDSAQVIVRENAAYHVAADQGLIFSSSKDGMIYYDVSSSTPSLGMSGPTTVFNGLRLLEGTENGEFYSFRGGYKWQTSEKATKGGELVSEYNDKLAVLYGYYPKSSVDMDIQYVSREEDASGKLQWVKKDAYHLSSGELEAMIPKDKYIANYFYQEPYKETPKKKAVIFWSYGKGAEDKQMFETAVQQKKYQLLAQGYTADQIEIVYFDDQESWVREMNTMEDVTYYEIISHGWVYDEGKVGTHRYYEEKEGEEPSGTYALTATEIHDYFVLRENKVSDKNIELYFKMQEWHGLEADQYEITQEQKTAELRRIGMSQADVAEYLGMEATKSTDFDILDHFKAKQEEQEKSGRVFNDDGAVCVISTCHSAAQYSSYSPNRGVQAVQDEGWAVAQAIKSAVGDDATVYGTIGPLYAAKNEDGQITALVPVLDVLAPSEGTYQPSAEIIYTQDMPYYEITKN